MATRQVAKWFLFIIVIHLFINPTLTLTLFTPPPPEILHNLCFQFFLDACIRVVPREIKGNGYSNFWGVNQVHYGVGENGPLFKP